MTLAEHLSAIFRPARRAHLVIQSITHQDSDALVQELEPAEIHQVRFVNDRLVIWMLGEVLPNTCAVRTAQMVIAGKVIALNDFIQGNDRSIATFRMPMDVNPRIEDLEEVKIVITQ